jgi:hypothetical protein
MKQDMEYYTTGEEVFNKAVENYNNERYLESIDGFYEVLQNRDKYTFASWANIARAYVHINKIEDSINPLRKVLMYDGRINNKSSIDVYKSCYIKLKEIMSNNVTYDTNKNRNVLKQAEARLLRFYK